MLDFSMYQSGVDFKCPYSNRPLKPLTHLNRLNAIFGYNAKTPYQLNWYMSLLLTCNMKRENQSAGGILPLSVGWARISWGPRRGGTQARRGWLVVERTRSSRGAAAHCDTRAQPGAQISCSASGHATQPAS
jgi:hypothetical protein